MDGKNSLGRTPSTLDLSNFPNEDFKVTTIGLFTELNKIIRRLSKKERECIKNFNQKSLIRT